MSVQILALVTIKEDEPQALAAYLAATEPLLAKVGAKIVQRFQVTDVVVGKRPAKTMMIVDYPSEKAVFEVFSSQAYLDIIPMRDAAFEDYSITMVSNSV